MQHLPVCCTSQRLLSLRGGFQVAPLLDTLMPILAAAAAVGLILLIKRWHASRPHRFTAWNGLVCTGHPGCRLTGM